MVGEAGRWPVSAREAILGAVRATRRDHQPVPAGWRRDGGMDRAARLDRFLERLAAYNCEVVRLAGPGEIATAVAARLAARASSHLVVPEGLPPAWLPRAELRHEAVTPDSGLMAEGAVITACALAIAETGTLILDAGPGQGRRALTLLPDHHICVVFQDQIAGLVPEAVTALRPAVLAGRPITFISGPSATADIEFDRVVGVHGPRKLDVLVIQASSQGESV